KSESLKTFIRNCTGNGVRDLMLDQKYPKPPCELINTDQ
ncbi:hypothetical protein NPIL_630271, partial [Nephila pilipes]